MCVGHPSVLSTPFLITYWHLLMFVTPESTKRESIPFTSANFMSVCKLSPIIKNRLSGRSSKLFSFLIRSKANLEGLPITYAYAYEAVSIALTIQPPPG